jgi:hypothetical protein
MFQFAYGIELSSRNINVDVPREQNYFIEFLEEWRVFAKSGLAQCLDREKIAYAVSDEID